MKSKRAIVFFFGKKVPVSLKSCGAYSTCLVKELCHNRRFTLRSTAAEEGVQLWTANQEVAVHQPPLRQKILRGLQGDNMEKFGSDDEC